MVGCFRGDGEADRISRVEVGIWGVLGSVLVGRSGRVEVVDIYSRSSPDVGERFMTLLPDLRETNIDRSVCI